MKLFVIEIKFNGGWKALFLSKGCFRNIHLGTSEFAELHGYASDEIRARRVKSQKEKDRYDDLEMLGGNVEPFEWCGKVT